MQSTNETNPQRVLFNFWGLSILLSLVLVFQLVGYFISKYALSGIYGISAQEVTFLMTHPDGTALSINIGRWSNLISFICYMGIPAFLFLAVNRVSIAEIGGFKQKFNWGKGFWAIAVGLTAIPVVGVLTKVISIIPFPAIITRLAEKLSHSRTAMFENLLDMEHIGELFICLGIAAALPAILEEIIFRGIILKIGFTQYRKPIRAIIFQAIIFAILHFSMYELPGIFMMGALFGYIAKENNNLWYNMLAHFVFNGFTILLHYLALKEFAKTGIAIDENFFVNVYIAIPSSLVLGLAINKLTKPTNE